MEFKVIKNTYPRYEKVANAEIDDICGWELSKGCYQLIRENDKRVVFATSQVDKDGLLRNGKRPILYGTIAKYKEYELIIERIRQ